MDTLPQDFSIMTSETFQIKDLHLSPAGMVGETVLHWTGKLYIHTKGGVKVYKWDQKRNILYLVKGF